MVLIKRTHRVGKEETVLVLIRNQQPAIRNLLETGDDDHIFLFITNPKCPPQHVSKKDINVIGMMGRIKRRILPMFDRHGEYF